jgi:predicted TIM-barrel fold metal-dependent hydrolase
VLIDIHTHATLYRTVPRSDGRFFVTSDELLSTMDRVGIDLAVVLPLVSPAQRSVLITTEEVLALCERCPDRLIPFCNVDPRQEGNAPDADLSRYFQIYKGLGCRGMGECTANLPFDDPLVENLFAHCQAAGLPLTLHIAPQVGGTYGLVDDLHLPRLERALQRFPDLRFLGHSPPFWSEISGDVGQEDRAGYPGGPVAPGGRLLDLLRAYPNLYGDLSAGSGFNAISRDPAFGYRFLEEHQDRLLFGTDIVYAGQELPIVEYLRSAVQRGQISRQAFERIAWRNAVRLLGLDIR